MRPKTGHGQPNPYPQKQVNTTQFLNGKAVTTNYLWDEFSQYGDLALEADGTNTIAYTLANGMVLSQTTNGITNYLLPDAQNSTRAVSNAAGNITSNYDYDAFGNLRGFNP